MILSRCNPLKEKIEGTWVVDKAYIYDEPAVWDLYGNGIGLESNNNCVLPPINNYKTRTKGEREGLWRVYEKEGVPYLKIETENTVFNKTFRIENLRQERDSYSMGQLMKMSLVSDSVRFDCTKAVY